MKMLQTVRVGELKQMLDAVQRNELTEDAREICTAKLRAIEQRETELMRQDTELAVDIAPQAPEYSGPNGRVVLTGATGFFGSFMLDSLLRLSDSDVSVVVRSHDVDHAQRRIESALQRVAPRDAEAAADLRRRVSVHCGDLAQPRLGLADDCWKCVSDEASAVYHCGAEVDYVRPYEALRRANVQGTQEALRLACDGRPKSFHLVSTTFIFGWSAPRTLLESDCNPEMKELDFGYAQTKWVAEQLVFEAAGRGMQASVYRPSLLTASLGGHYVRRDITVRILAYMIRHGITVDIENQLSFLPADIAADNLIALSQLEQAPATTYHLTADHYYSFPVVTDVINRDFGYDFDYMDLESFIEHVNRHCTKDDLLFPLIPFINTNFRKLEHMRHKRYNNEQYRTGRERSAHSCPEPPLEQTLGAIVEFLQREQLIPSASAVRSSS
jgi:thioester reductase-like protein